MDKRLICKILGHIPINVNTKEFTAKCKRCGVGLEVSYDMLYGCTCVSGVIE